ncbi:hypothetical protein [Ruegeria marina]|uniref:Alpha/beta hydrolase family protein n=1 Tax=Ruegeria marina TaxID=639004 RepID=A0A1G7EA49_9RHOB|nr:hypothetical protein [Ruegeria marina]SDE60316.1 hypothetical protein SAMN04488239_12441 [Ruegeria marina]
MKKEKFNNSSGKVSGESIKNLQRQTVSSATAIRSSGLYTVDVDGIDFDLAFFKKDQVPAGTPLFVFFSGFVHRAQTPLPAFQRWSWHNNFPGHTLYISDPLLKKTEDLGLGWYIGTRARDINHDIANIVRRVAQNLETSVEDIVFYGSSGGGFATLRALVEIPEAQAVTINPQILLTSFEGNALKRYLDVFFDGMTKKEFAVKHSYRNSVIARSNIMSESRIVYVQNTCDPHHMDEHFSKIFEKKNGKWESPYLKNSTLIFFEDDRGHAVGEPPELVPEILEKLTLLKNSRIAQ